MAALPYMQLYVADYLADTPHLTTEEHGAYLLLLFSYWQTGKPLRVDRLSSSARLSNERWTDVKRTLKEFFKEVDGVWIHPRVEKDLEKVAAKSGKNSEAGKASAAARALAKQQLEALASEENLTNVGTSVERTLNERSTTRDASTIEDTDTDTDKDQKPLSLGEPNDDIRKSKLSYSQIQNAYNDTCGHVLAKCIAMPERRKAKIRSMCALVVNDARPFRDFGIEFWIAYFNDALQNPWNTGSNDRGWRAEFDYLVNPTNALKILEKTHGA